MSKKTSEVTKLRRKVFSNIAKLALEDRLLEEVEELPQRLIPEQGLGYRCCVHKERAIMEQRIKSVLGLDSNVKVKSLREAAIKALELDNTDGPIIDILEIACDSCPLDKYRVSDACRNCVDHSCMNVCPQDAIVIIENRAYIDQNKCVECGLCYKACPYNAILEMRRPCENACQVDAIKANSDRRATIDYDSCISCGSCVQACPFGAITYKSHILQVIKMLKEDDVVAILAPSFVGQFGSKVTPYQIKEGLRRLGFAEAYEVALGADIVAIEETEELLRKVPNKQDYLMNSCCPAFLSLVKQDFPQLIENVSTTVSPMVALTKVLKKDDSDIKVVFIGPCVAKKDEGLDYQILDSVLTFEEIGSIFVGAGINLSNIPQEVSEERVSAAGRTFGRSGGLVEAVTGSANKLDPSNQIKAVNAQGIEECIKVLRLAQANQYQNYFIEGMGCKGGCAGGPGSLTNSKVVSKSINTFGQRAEIKEAIDNNYIKDKLTKLDKEEFHRKD